MQLFCDLEQEISYGSCSSNSSCISLADLPIACAMTSIDIPLDNMTCAMDLSWLSFSLSWLSFSANFRLSNFSGSGR